MESFSEFSLFFGEQVRRERKRLSMNQVEFYVGILGGDAPTEEAIKKKMNAVENGKQKSVDLDMLIALCKYCDVSADYLIKGDDYRNHDVEFVCKYTGLSQDVVEKLHNWAMAAENDVDANFCHQVYTEREEQKHRESFDKEAALKYLSIINYLFEEWEEGKSKKNKERKSNLSILNSLYLLVMDEPKVVWATIKDYYGNDDRLELLDDKSVYVEPDNMMFADVNEVWFPLDCKDMIRQIAKNRLDKQIEAMQKHYSEGR